MSAMVKQGLLLKLGKMDVVVIERRELCTFDNMRLYAARKFSPPGHQMVVKRHNFSDIVSEEKLETGAGDVIFW